MRQTAWAAALVLAGAVGAGAQGVEPVLPEATGTPVAVRVDLTKSEGPAPRVWNWFGYDEANYTTMRDGRRLLGELHDLSPIPVWVRAHHLLTSGDGTPELKWSSTGVYREDAAGRPVYDWRVLDGIFDAYRAAGVRPMVELGFMPEALAAEVPGKDGARRPYQVHYPASTVAGAVNNPPRDYGKWGGLVEAVVRHLVERYGRATVEGWLFEVWNEPDIDYWHGTPEEYWRLYDFAAAGVRRALPAAKVGGPASTGPGSARAAVFLDGFLSHVERDRSAADGGTVPLDFISFHAKGRPTVEGAHVRMGLQYELRDADAGFAVVARHERLRNLPIVLSEADPEGCAACSSKVNPANNYRNGAVYPAYTAVAVKALAQLAQRRGVNLLGMLSWSFEFEDKEYFEGFRSLSTNGIDKPVLNLFRMLGLMDGQGMAVESAGTVPLADLLEHGTGSAVTVDGVATRAADGTAAALVWRYDDAAVEGAAVPVDVTIAGLGAQGARVLVSRWRIDSVHSNAYTVWKAMGSPQAPTAAQYAELQRRAGLEMDGSPVWAAVQSGSVTVRLPMEPHAVELVRVEAQR